MTSPAFLPAKTLAGLIRRKKIGSAELLDLYLARVEKYNPAVNAIVAAPGADELIAAARKRARAADRALAKGEVWGPFHGVPMTAKEAFDVAGLPTTWGLPQFKDNRPAEDAVAVVRLRGAGAIPFGKTNVPAWLADGQSFNAVYGVTRNPWDLSRTPGGSSGGAAAALAAGLTALEIGSDIASSIRNPSNYCGTYGHKPTYGICPPRGHAVTGRLTPDDINVVGPMARSAFDLDAMLLAMAGPDDLDAAGWTLALPKPRQRALKEFRVGVLLSDAVSEVDEEVQAAIARLADVLRREKVKVTMDAKPAIDMARAQFLFNTLLRAATSHRQTDEEFAEAVKAADALDPADDSHAARMMRAVALRHRDWLLLNEERHRMRLAWRDFFRSYDVLVCPMVTTPAHPHVHDVPTYQRTIVINGKTLPWFTMLFWAGLTGASYLPSTAIPIGFSKTGLPIGAQVVGPAYGDLACIRFAQWLERAYQGFVPPPGFE